MLAPAVEPLLNHLTVEQVESLVQARRRFHQRWQTLSVCDFVSYYCYTAFGWRMQKGDFLGAAPPEGVTWHMWNLLPDGSIVDASADQFGLEAILVVPRYDFRQDWYSGGDLTDREFLGLAHCYRPPL